MNNYIILNGINSNTITGLIIQSLPPITKPLMRTNIETIDGKDGDIITKLGYSAYDKEFSIGLSYNYNVDDVIEFFNSEGTVIFSNEPTKYYKYTILDQIDFNRLIRFKTATVRMHVQPFKYSTTEEDIEENATETDAEGVNFTLENTENGAGFIDLKLKGQTEQKTYSGKNLLNNTLSSGTKNGITYTVNEDNSVTMNGTATAITWLILNDSISLKAGTYTMSQGNTTNTVRVYCGALSGYCSNGVRTQTITETKTSDISINIPNGTTVSNLTLFPMVENGSVATEYEQYVGGIPTPNPNYPQEIKVVTGDNTVTIKNSDNTESQSYTLSLGDIELCKIGDYQDYIYPANNTWYIHKDIVKHLIKPTTNAQIEENGVRFRDYSVGTQVGAYPMLYSNYFIRASNYNEAVNNGTSTPNTIGLNTSGIVICNISGYTTTTEYYDFFSNNNVYIYRPLLTPIDEEITDATLLSQLNALKGATTYEGETNIITAGDLQPIIYVKTFAMDNPSYTVTNSGNYFAKPVMTIYGIGTVGVYLDGVQVLSLNLNENQTDHITIDVPNMNAYTDTINTLRNRAVTGDYNNLKFNVGDNELSFSGTIQGFIIQNYSRWL